MPLELSGNRRIVSFAEKLHKRRLNKQTSTAHKILIMVKPIPDNVKEILGQLTGPQQVALRTYIASLRNEIKELEQDALTKNDPDPHAHYHGHERCTHDHGHDAAEHKGDSHEHKHEHKHAKVETHDHDHKHDHEHGDHCEHESHAHKHHDHKTHDHGHDHKKEHSKGHHHHDHSHEDKKEHKAHDHGHDHAHEEDVKMENADEDIPAWKKEAMSADPSAAPFGGSWNTESNVSAKGT